MFVNALIPAARIEGNAEMFEVLKTTNGGFFWRLKAANGETLCHSEVYNAKASALNGIDAVRRIAPAAPLRDLTQ